MTAHNCTVTLNLTSTGRGHLKCSLYFPNLRWSRIDSGLMLFSVLVTIVVASFRLYLSLSYLGAPFAAFFYSINHYITFSISSILLESQEIYGSGCKIIYSTDFSVLEFVTLYQCLLLIRSTDDMSKLQSDVE